MKRDREKARHNRRDAAPATGGFTFNDEHLDALARAHGSRLMRTHPPAGRDGEAPRRRTGKS